jgi:dephospho-CoA kinase
MNVQSALEMLVKNHCIALTGGIASGKSTIAQMLKDRGHLVFDADQCARAVVEPGQEGIQKLRAQFGSDILQLDGSLDRAKMKDLMIQDVSVKNQLDRIMHPLIRDEFLRQIQATDLASHPRTFFYEAALIHETNRAGDFKATWCAYCPSDIQLARLIARSAGKLSPAAARALIATQMPIAEKARISTRIIDTSTTLASVRSQVETLLTSE